MKWKLGMNKTLARTMESISWIDPIHAMLTEWPFGNITEEFEIGVELMKKNLKHNKHDALLQYPTPMNKEK